MKKSYIQKAKQIINDAQAILITAGAGMGVDSGLPDFRGDEGFWREYPIIKDMEISFEEMANPLWFATNPPLAWAFYGHRLNLYRDTVPHDGFKMLLNMVKEKQDNYFIYTSNVDGQFQKAKFSDDKIYEVHGSINHLQCSENCTNDIWNASEEKIDINMDKFEAINIPLCPKCEDIARPNILMFGDWNWNSNRANLQKQKYKQWIKDNKNKRMAIIEIGAGVDIPTIRNEGEHLAKYYENINLIRINPRDYQVNFKYGISLPFGGLDGLSEIIVS